MRRKKDETLLESKLLKYMKAIPANHSKLDHIFLCVGHLPNFYFDKPFNCKGCGSQEVWKAHKQKHYFEVMKGKHLDAIAIHCKACRNVEKQRVNLQKQHMNEMAKNKSHPNELFFKDIEAFKEIKNTQL